MEIFRKFKKKYSSINETLLFVLKVVLVISIFSNFYHELWHLMSISVLLLVLLFIPQILKKSHKIKIPKEFELILFVFVLIMVFLGDKGGIITPVFFGIAIGFIGFLFMLLLYSKGKIEKEPFFIVLFAVSLSITAGFGVELSKYYLKVLLNQDLGSGLYNFSMKIMSYVSIGAVISGFLGYLYMTKRLVWFRKIIERFEKINPGLFKQKDYKNKIKEMIKKGESKNLEFKSTLRTNLHTIEKDRRIENSVLKTISAFMNTEGGTLLIGVTDRGEVSGIEKDNFPDDDKFLLHFSNLIKEKIGKKFLHLIDFDIIKVENKKIMIVKCKQSNKPVFIKEDSSGGSGGEVFYVRIGPGSVKLQGSEMLDYIKKRFEEA